MKARALLAAAAMVFSAPTFAVPIVLTLTGPLPGNTVGPQSASNPCIIAGTTCQNGTFPYTNFDQSGNLSQYTESSPTYTVSQFANNNFDIAIDVNTAQNGETLQYFDVFIGGNLVYQYSGPTPIAPVNSNGNGYADWTLSHIDLSSYAAGTTVLFTASWTGSSDGAESFFLVNGTNVGPPPQEIPEPGILALLSLGLLAVAVTSARGRKA